MDTTIQVRVIDDFVVGTLELQDLDFNEIHEIPEEYILCILEAGQVFDAYLEEDEYVVYAKLEGYPHSLGLYVGKPVDGEIQLEEDFELVI